VGCRAILGRSARQKGIPEAERLLFPGRVVSEVRESCFRGIIATRARFTGIVYQGKNLASTGSRRLYLDVTHIPRENAGPQASKGFWKSTEKFCRAVDPRKRADESFSGDALHDGGGFGWNGGRSSHQYFRYLRGRASANTSITGPNRLGANSLVSCNFWRRQLPVRRR